MAKSRSSSSAKSAVSPVRTVLRWALVAVAAGLALALLATLLLRFVGPWTTPYQMAESRRLGGIEQAWVPMEQIAPAMARSVVAAEDADFCLHWGIDVDAVRAALEEGGNRGGSTISQQVVKNVFLWQGRSWVRKSIEAVWTPVTEAIWPKRRILELYLNEVEFAEGVFGVGAAAPYYFGVSAADLTDTQAARLAMVLPDPKGRDAANPTGAQRQRSASILDGAATIARDGRAACFED